MKVIFAGPSIADLTLSPPDVSILPPAVFGDVERAVLDGANVIGLIDGRFQQTASIWHKEILFALSLGVRVLGASSMGALRAAECESFGMIAVGVIAKAYAAGELVDDGDVALLHEPAEGRYRAITEPMVNVLATADRMLDGGVAETRVAALVAHARGLHFSERTATELFGPGSPVADLAPAYERLRVDQKAADAATLIDAVAVLPDDRTAPPGEWRLLRSRFWEERAS